MMTKEWCTKIFMNPEAGVVVLCHGHNSPVVKMKYCTLRLAIDQSNQVHGDDELGWS